MAARLSNGTPPPPPPDLAHLMERVRALEQSVQQIQVDHKESHHDHWNNNTSPHLLHTIDKQLDLSSSSPRSPRFAYSTSQKKPAVPSVFQMPLHYPRFTKADYETMPEWKLDRLLEEYGLPVLGSLREKRQYAMGVFLWKNQRK